MATGLVGHIASEFRWQLARDRTRIDHSRLVADRFRPRRPSLTAGEVHSPWTVEHASAVLPGREAGGCATDFQLVGRSVLDLFIADATGSGAMAPIYRGLTNVLWRTSTDPRTNARDGSSPRRLEAKRSLWDVNRHLQDYIAPGDHVTALYAVVDLLSGAVTYASADHAAAFVLGRRGGLTMLRSGGVPLGTADDRFAERVDDSRIRLADGQSLLLVTQGVLAARNEAGEPFGIERLSRCLRGRPGCNAEAVIETVQRAIESFTARAVLPDEGAIVCLRLASPTSRERDASGALLEPSVT